MKFSEIPGNQQIKEKLVRTVQEQRVSHAQLFYGPEGSDKLALAIAYAQYINCTAKQSVTPGSVELPDSCGTCPSCVKYQKLIHPDLHFIYPVATTKKITSKPQSKFFLEEWRAFLLHNNFNGGLQNWYETIGIENKQGIINAYDCNEIITTLSYKSYESEYKVMIIWMVEKLYVTAAPKILKVLEEPPEKTLFILISDDPDQIIRTILSRTLMVRIPKSLSEMVQGKEDDSTHFITFRQWMRDCYAGKIINLVPFAAEISKAGREKQKSFLQYALKTIGHCASMTFLGQTNEPLEGEELTFIRNFSPFIQPGHLIQISSLLNDAIYHIERNAHPATLFLDISLKFVQLFKPEVIPHVRPA